MVPTMETEGPSKVPAHSHTVFMGVHPRPVIWHYVGTNKTFPSDGSNGSTFNKTGLSGRFEHQRFPEASQLYTYTFPGLSCGIDYFDKKT